MKKFSLMTACVLAAMGSGVANAQVVSVVTTPAG